MDQEKMRKEIKNSDQKVREKLDEFQFDFDPMAWGKMQQALKEKQEGTGSANSDNEQLPGIVDFLKNNFAKLLFLVLGFLLVSLYFVLQESPLNTQEFIQEENLQKDSETNNNQLSVLPSSPTSRLERSIVKEKNLLANHSENKPTNQENTLPLKRRNTSSDQLDSAISEIAVKEENKVVDETLKTKTTFFNTLQEQNVSKNVIQNEKLFSQSNETAATGYSLQSIDPLPNRFFGVVSDSIESIPVKQISLADAYFSKKPTWGVIFGSTIPTVNYDSIPRALVPMLGIYWKKRIRPRLVLQAEVHTKFNRQFQFKKPFADSIDTGTSVIYKETDITTAGLLFLELPLSIKQYNRKGTLGLFTGFKPAYIFPLNGSKAFYLSKEEQANRGGLNRLDMSILLGAEFKVNRSLYIDVRYNQAFRDITKNEWFEDEKLHHNSDIQLSLRAQF